MRRWDIVNGASLWATGRCTRCGQSGGHDEQGSSTLGWIEDDDHRRRICPDCCTAAEYGSSARPFLHMMERAKGRGTNLPEWLFDEAQRIREEIWSQEQEEAAIRDWVAEPGHGPR